MSDPILLTTEQVLAFPLTGLRLIEASAGTGKTYTIANLYLRHIVEGREVGQVLVVTFTVAATDELRGRIRARLYQALEVLEQDGANASGDDEFLAELTRRIRAAGDAEAVATRLRLAVRAMDEAAVYTIHSFCQRALAEFAFNSGQRFQMDLLTDDRDLWWQAVRDWWRRTGYPLNPAKARLFHEALAGFDRFTTRLAPLLGPRRARLLPDTGDLAVILARFDALVPVLEALAGDWRTEGARLADRLRSSKGLSRGKTCPFHPDRLGPALALLDDWAAAEPTPAPPPAFEVLCAGIIDANRLKRTTDPALTDPFFDRCEQLRQDLDAIRAALYPAALAEASAYAREQVRALKQQAQVLSFDDLLTELHAALGRQQGNALAEALRTRFPVAMIDEFQDTDPIQYGIFRRLYLDRPECGLILIGDPKQAIYSFRGGDIFTYMQAKADVGGDGIYGLNINWRSTPDVIKAVNALFQQRPHDAFVYADTIPFVPIDPAPKRHRVLTVEDRPHPPLTLWTLPEADKPIAKAQARAAAHQAVSDEIARLIAAGREGHARLGTEPLRPRDIAVLVRTSHEGAELRRVLASRGVDAVCVERDGVFQSAEATALEPLLEAVLNPRDRDSARQASASPLLGRDYADIEALIHGEDAWAAWVDRLLQLHETWRRKGFMTMFHALLRELGIAQALARGDTPERRLTNVLHLGELLQQASKAHAGMDALVAWYRRQRERAVLGETELRLESDAALVRIVTIHASKGLEYPVVFVPYLWSCRPSDREGPLAFHEDTELCLDAGSDALDRHFIVAERERLAEDVRLAYVALTRAESALYLVWGRAGSRAGHAGQTALGYLLHPGQVGERLAEVLPDAFAAGRDLGADLERLTAATDGAIHRAPLPEAAEGPRPPPAQAPPPLAPRRFRGRIADDWRVGSFSALTRDVHSGPSPSREDVADDPGLRFPAGSHVGSYLHLLLERLDFQDDIEAQVLEHSARIAPRFNLDHQAVGEDAATLLARVTRTPLNDDGLMLAGIGHDRRFNELEFDFATETVDIGLLDRRLADAADRPLEPLAVATFRGMVNGIIDLVFEADGRFYIADYKSNFLGGDFADYGPERLLEAVYQRRYDLQYLLYTLALHRYLGLRLPNYDYQRDFGGVYYLFLRGMRPETGPTHGVYATHPPLALIETLDSKVFPHRIPDGS